MSVRPVNGVIRLALIIDQCQEWVVGLVLQAVSVDPCGAPIVKYAVHRSVRLFPRGNGIQSGPQPLSVVCLNMSEKSSRDTIQLTLRNFLAHCSRKDCAASSLIALSPNPGCQ